MPDSDDEAPADNGRPQLVDFSVSYGECVGYCTTVLVVSGTDLTLVRLSDDDVDPELRYRGRADRSIVERIRAAAATAVPKDLEPVYGTPDAHDEGAATIRLLSETLVTQHQYSATEPPPPLQDLHELLSAIMIAWIDNDEIHDVNFDEVP